MAQATTRELKLCLTAVDLETRDGALGAESARELGKDMTACRTTNESYCMGTQRG